MKISKNLLVGTSLLVGLLGLSLLSGCGSRSEDIQGLLQSVEGKELVIKQDDGSTTRISVKDDSAAAQMVGSQVTVTAHKSGDGPEIEMEKIELRGEDSTTSGVIESISGDTWVIGGKTIKVVQTTILDDGLAVGVTARVEFIKQADGTLIAKEIETDADDDAADADEDIHFAGQIQSTGPGGFVIGGKTFKVDSKTVLDSGLGIGVNARVEFITLPDGTLLATEIETDADDSVLDSVLGDDKGGGDKAEPGDDKGGGSGSGSSGK
ncbi:MAG: hypothetical protein HYX80_07065 [Chloroflexi bacterium]|nr:hypothetical protein [Chloroflexota bacterium]